MSAVPNSPDSTPPAPQLDGKADYGASSIQILEGLEAVRKRELQSLTLDFEDGAIFHLRRDQRWRFWRR